AGSSRTSLDGRYSPVRGSHSPLSSFIDSPTATDSFILPPPKTRVKPNDGTDANEVVPLRARSVAEQERRPRSVCRHTRGHHSAATGMSRTSAKVCHDADDVLLLRRAEFGIDRQRQHLVRSLRR